MTEKERSFGEGNLYFWFDPSATLFFTMGWGEAYNSAAETFDGENRDVREESGPCIGVNRKKSESRKTLSAEKSLRQCWAAPNLEALYNSMDSAVLILWWPRLIFNLSKRVREGVCQGGGSNQ